MVNTILRGRTQRLPNSGFSLGGRVAYAKPAQCKANSLAIKDNEEETSKIRKLRPGLELKSISAA